MLGNLRSNQTLSSLFVISSVSLCTWFCISTFLMTPAHVSLLLAFRYAFTLGATYLRPDLFENQLVWRHSYNYPRPDLPNFWLESQSCCFGSFLGPGIESPWLWLEFRFLVSFAKNFGQCMCALAAEKFSAFDTFLHCTCRLNSKVSRHRCSNGMNSHGMFSFRFVA